MDMIMFLNNNTGSNKSVTISKMMIRYNITIKEAEEIYTKWRKGYLMDYTPVNKLIHNYNYHVNNYRR